MPPTTSPSPLASLPETPTGAPQQDSTLNQPKKNRMPLFVGVGVAVLIVLAGATFLAYKAVVNNVRLTSFSNGNFSLLVPAGYARTEDVGGISFKETTGAADTRSEVIAFYQKLPANVSAADAARLQTNLKNLLQTAADSKARSNGAKLQGTAVVDTTLHGTAGYKLTAKVTKDDKIVGTYTLFAAVNDKAVYMIGVGAHSSDANLAKKTDQIIQSLKIK